MNRADIILETIYQYYSTLALEDSAPVDLAELIDNAIVEQMDARVGTAYNLGHDEGWNEGFESGLVQGYNEARKDYLNEA
jgi:flagellar biosynthesis/type III secretory pathway protein FliH